MQIYRARKRKAAPNPHQSQFLFEEVPEPGSARSIAIAEPNLPAQEQFAFTLAIGRKESPAKKDDHRMEINVSIPPKPQPSSAQPAPNTHADQYGAYPVASLEERRLAAVIDFICLVFAYGGFLALFGSLGGQFSLNKLSTAVYAATFAIVYLQYFALFTIFGGTTPGMMFRGLQVTSFDGDPPQPRQMLLRSLGYMLSAGTLFLGFLWASWDEDGLTWHDRFSRTYLSVAEDFTSEAAEVARSHSH